MPKICLKILVTPDALGQTKFSKNSNFQPFYMAKDTGGYCSLSENVENLIMHNPMVGHFNLGLNFSNKTVETVYF